MPPAQDLCPYLEGCRSSVAYSARNLELDSCLLNLCWDDILWTKTNLFMLGLASGEMPQMLPLVQAPVPKSAEAVMLCVPAGTQRKELLASSTCSINPSPG